MRCLFAGFAKPRLANTALKGLELVVQGKYSAPYKLASSRSEMHRPEHLGLTERSLDTYRITG